MQRDVLPSRVRITVCSDSWPAARWLIASLALLSALRFSIATLLHVNQTTVALSFLLAILAVSAVWGMAVSVFMSLVAMLAFNYFFLPPVGTLTIADPQNWVALFAFLVTSITGQPAFLAHSQGSGRSASAPPRSRAVVSLQPQIAGRRQRHPTDERDSRLHRREFRSRRGGAVLAAEGQVLSFGIWRRRISMKRR